MLTRFWFFKQDVYNCPFPFCAGWSRDWGATWYCGSWLRRKALLPAHPVQNRVPLRWTEWPAVCCAWRTHWWACLSWAGSDFCFVNLFSSQNNSEVSNDGLKLLGFVVFCCCGCRSTFWRAFVMEEMAENACFTCERLCRDKPAFKKSNRLNFCFQLTCNSSFFLWQETNNNVCRIINWPQLS